MSKPNDTIIVRVNGEDREIFMSFGLLNELTKRIGDPSRVSAVAVDPELRDTVLEALLATRSESGKVKSPVKLEDVAITIDDVENLIEWSTEHALGFFIRALKKVVALTKNNETEMKALASFATGLNDSASEKVSSGVSTSDLAPLT